MLIFDSREIGSRLLIIRKKTGLTQVEVAEKSNLSDRAYADIERGESSMRLDTLLRICKTLNITPNDILVDEKIRCENLENCLSQVRALKGVEMETAVKLLDVYLSSLR